MLAPPPSLLVPAWCVRSPDCRIRTDGGADATGTPIIFQGHSADAGASSMSMLGAWLPGRRPIALVLSSWRLFELTLSGLSSMHQGGFSCD